MLYKKLAISLLVASFTLLSTVSTGVHAGMLNNDDLLTETNIQLNKAFIIDAMAREDVQKLFASKGISEQQALARVESMTDAEIQTLASDIDNMPAGAGLGEAIIFALVILIITDSVGITDVFPRI